MAQAATLLKSKISSRCTHILTNSPLPPFSSYPLHIDLQCGNAMQRSSQCDCISIVWSRSAVAIACTKKACSVVTNAYIAWQGVRNNTIAGSRRTSMPKAKKHLMPIENRRPARPMMAKASASKSQCDGLCLLACAFSKKPYKQAVLTEHACNMKYVNCVGISLLENASYCYTAVYSAKSAISSLCTSRLQAKDIDASTHSLNTAQ